MKFEYVFMGYISFVIVRFYCCVLRDQLVKWRAGSEDETLRMESTPQSYPRT